MSSSTAWSRHAHSGCALAVTSRAAKRAHVRGVDDLEVGEVVAVAARAVDGAGVLDGGEAVAHGPVAERVDVHLEVLGVQRRDVLAQVVGGDEGEAAVVGAVPVRVEVGVEHRGRVGLADAVLHDLDAGGAHPGLGRPAAALDELGHLLQAALAVPPQGQHHLGGEPAGPVRVEVGVQGVEHPEALADQGVLPADDADGVQVPLRGQQPGHQLVLGRPWARGRRRGPSRPRAAHRSGVPSGPRSIRPSAGSGVCASMPASSRARVLTHAEWWSRLGRKTGRSGHARSSRSAVGTPPGKASIDQPPPVTHGRSGCSRGVRRDPLDVLLDGAEVGEVAQVQLGAGLHRVDVRVVEGRQQPASGEALDPGAGADEVGDVVVAADAGDRARRVRRGSRRPSVRRGTVGASRRSRSAGRGAVRRPSGCPIVGSGGGGGAGQRPATTSAARARGEVVDRPAASWRSAAW